MSELWRWWVGGGPSSPADLALPLTLVFLGGAAISEGWKAHMKRDQEIAEVNRTLFTAHVAMRSDGVGVTFSLKDEPTGEEKWSWTFDAPIADIGFNFIPLVNQAMYLMDKERGRVNAMYTDCPNLVPTRHLAAIDGGSRAVVHGL